MKKTRSLRRTGACAVLATALLAGACADADPVASEAAPAPAPSAAGQRLAEAMAGALARPETRTLVIQAMQQSAVNEHKVVLQELAATQRGAPLVQAMAGAAGVDAATVRGWMAALPPLDFYAPVPEHRRSWHATADVTVGYTADVDSPLLTAFGTDGKRYALDSRAGVPAQPVLILHAAERKYLRPRANPATYVMPGEACDPEVAIVMCDEEGSGGGGGGTGGGGTTTTGPKLTRFITYPGDGWGDSEVVFTHFYLNSLGNRVDVWDWMKGNVEEDEWVTVNQPTTLSTFVHVMEDDAAGTLNDDDWGQGQIAPSGTATQVYSLCVTVFRDGFGVLNCPSYPQQILTAQIVYTY